MFSFGLEFIPLGLIIRIRRVDDFLDRVGCVGFDFYHCGPLGCCCAGRTCLRKRTVSRLPNSTPALLEAATELKGKILSVNLAL